MATIADRIVSALLARGEREVTSTSRSRKYRCFTRSVNGGFYWVGRCGALRIGQTSTGSLALSRGFVQRLIGS